MTQFSAVVKASLHIEGFDRTMIVLVPPSDYDFSGPGIEWPLTLYLPGYVKKQNSLGTKYKVIVEREEE